MGKGKASERAALSIDDADGRRIHAAWSRSGRRCIITVTAPLYSPFAQVVLDATQVETLGRLLTARPTEIEASFLTLDDPDEEADLMVAWDSRRPRVSFSAAPIRGTHQDDRATVSLTDREASRLARFLEHGP